MLVRDGTSEDGHAEAYADALWRVRAVLGRLEEWFGELDDGTVVTPSQALSQVAQVHGVYDQVVVGLRALQALGILQPDALGNGLRFDRSQLLATRPLRMGVQAGLSWAQQHTTGRTARLVAALPLGLRDDVVALVQRQADDLRAALVSLITAARGDLLLASPFWDDETVAELEPLLLRRLEAGVRVVILGRRTMSSRHELHGFARLTSNLARFPGFSALMWDEPQELDRFGSQTFHFKCVIVDSGTVAYLGSANLTSASLRSRMELGVILSGEPAQRLANTIEAIKVVSQRVY
jgi:phosphatidylserine/phosphatidylglycerophosphate/cardiolipin synthase-like enzyme